MKRQAFNLLAAVSSALFLVVCAVWAGNHATVPTYAAMSHSADEPYRPPRDTGLLVVPNGFYLMADQRIGAPMPWKWWVPYWFLLMILSACPLGYGVAKVAYYHDLFTMLRRRANGLCLY